MAQELERLNCVQWSAKPFLMAKPNTKSQQWNEATTDGVWHPAACSKHRIFDTKTPFCNWSSYYAMAVIELAEAVAREVKNTP
jgi:hypothetical protein